MKEQKTHRFAAIIFFRVGKQRGHSGACSISVAGTWVASRSSQFFSAQAFWRLFDQCHRHLGHVAVHGPGHTSRLTPTHGLAACQDYLWNLATARVTYKPSHPLSCSVHSGRLVQYQDSPV
jgi:hypothetical protein